jgi:hypothetical protein
MSRFFHSASLLVTAALALGASCRHAPAAAATPDDTALCQHLAAVGCSTGADPSCPVALARLRILEPVPSACLLDAVTPAAVVACGWECP